MCKSLKIWFIDKLIKRCSRLFVHDFRTESFVLSSKRVYFVLEVKMFSCSIQRFVLRTKRFRLRVKLFLHRTQSVLWWCYNKPGFIDVRCCLLLESTWFLLSVWFLFSLFLWGFWLLPCYLDSLFGFNMWVCGFCSLLSGLVKPMGYVTFSRVQIRCR